MKILYIPGENDYDASMFEQTYAGENVRKVIEQLRKGDKVYNKEIGEITYKVIDVPDVIISREFRDFIKNDVMDYDGGKHCNFYLETDII